MKIIRQQKDIALIPEHNWGSCYQDEITISYQSIVDKLGRPNSKGDGYKVSAEWIIYTPAGYGTIYDYKESKKYCGKDGLPTKDITCWHIGGSNKETADYIIDIFFK